MKEDANMIYAEYR